MRSTHAGERSSWMKQRKQFGGAGLEEADVNERRELGLRGCIRVDDSTRSSEDQSTAKRDLALGSSNAGSRE